MAGLTYLSFCDYLVLLVIQSYMKYQVLFDEDTHRGFVRSWTDQEFTEPELEGRFYEYGPFCEAGLFDSVGDAYSMLDELLGPYVYVVFQEPAFLAQGSCFIMRERVNGPGYRTKYRPAYVREVFDNVDAARAFVREENAVRQVQIARSRAEAKAKAKADSRTESEAVQL